MRAAGIVCEYNPFHNGHRIHIEKTREATGCEGVVAVMSGNFVQRGAPAIYSKQLRAELAVEQGADLVLEIPVIFTLRSAEAFAQHALFLLHATGVTDTLSFGVETPDLSQLQKIAVACADEAEPFRKALKEGLKRGESFPRARGNAIALLLGEQAAETARRPNNLLAIEYLKMIYRNHWNITPFPIARTGACHDSDERGDGIASASLIRQMLCAQEEEAARFLPSAEYEKLKKIRPTRMEDFDQAVMAALYRASVEELRMLPEMAEGLEFRFYRTVRECKTADEVLTRLKSKRYTHSRLRRMILYALLGITKEELCQQPLYLKPLAFNEVGQRLLHEMKTKAQLPIVRHTGQARQLRDEAVMKMWQRELVFDRIYELGNRGMK